ncbi:MULTISPECIES: CBS domain-containing protein [Nitrosopumilus]|uniref:XRE family transcriptional regulator n=1 Tax=Nitrosopumilus piranensis TaxID=1582439 RepID=A0A0C5BVZ9_9ARCH|nr:MULTISPECIES: CBS domain-containing protein [Nitrosopumilus]AJM92424.1 XRE family transcriptional regulator [Nitrosopumilus piranensis]KAF6244342.1 transcriptional regulator [Nitrosopumilus sp. b2]MCE2506286.1 helix-turn-helix domain-containing protein [Nitrosopumilaceae archaeon]
MLPNIESIKQMRQKLGITQKKLAGMTGVSTSMINQIESGRSQPSYETAKKIFENLSNLEGRSSSHKAGDFCSQDIVKMKPSNTLHDAIKKMHQLSISQIPVFDEKEIVGVVSEDGIVKHLADIGEAELKNAKLADTMDPVPPIVDFETPANVLVPLIRYSKCILVTKKSKIVGIITASDTLKMME